MEALVLERKDELNLRDIALDEALGPQDLRIAIHTVGVCGSDVHYYTHGGIGPFIVRNPMILGHEASGTVIETGAGVEDLKVGDRVCMEPGVPDPNSRETRLGMYNLDPKVRFWATPPDHGVLRPSVVHPAAFTFKLPDNVSFAEGAMIEPLAVGMHAVTKAGVKPGDVAVVSGAGPIGMLTALAALAGGCSKIFITDVIQEKLDLAASLGAITPVNVREQDLAESVRDLTGGDGADIVFEASGNPQAAAAVFEPLAPGGTVVYIGCPVEPVALEIVAAQAKEARILTIFRYAHIFPRALGLISSGAIDVMPLITDNFIFADSVEAFDYAVHMPPASVKVQINLPA